MRLCETHGTDEVRSLSLSLCTNDRGLLLLLRLEDDELLSLRILLRNLLRFNGSRELF